MNQARAENFLALARRSRQRGLLQLSDADFITLLEEHRWAIAIISRRPHDAQLRATLNAGVLATHAALHRRVKQPRRNLGAAIANIWPSFLLCAGVFFGACSLAVAAVFGDPTVAYALVPRDILAQIDAGAWGDRGSTAADIGMTFFYWGNNLRACFLATGLGVLGGFPALTVLAYNGALMGAVAGIAINRGVGARFWGWIAPHGVPELTALFVCGAVGWRLAHAWMQPGPRKRAVALADAGRQLTTLLLVAMVLVVIAAPLEGFVSPLLLQPWQDGAIAAGWAALLGIAARRCVSTRGRDASPHPYGASPIKWAADDK